jgi:hypothetical protein
VSWGPSVTQAHPPAPRPPRLPHPEVRPQPATAPPSVWGVEVRGGHGRAESADDAGQRRARGAAGPRGLPRPPTPAGALAPGYARPRAPAAVTASRHLSNISVTVGPLGPPHRPRTTRRMPRLAACRARCRDGAGPRHRHWHGACDAVSTGLLMDSATALHARSTRLTPWERPAVRRGRPARRAWHDRRWGLLACLTAHGAGGGIPPRRPHVFSALLAHRLARRGGCRWL